MEGTVFGGILAVLMFMLFQLCGMCIARLALPQESSGARTLLGSVCGSLMLHWFPILFAFFLGFTVAAHVCAMVLAALCAAVSLRLCRIYKRPGFSGALAVFCRKKFLFVPALMCLFFGFLVWKSFLFEDGRIYSSQATYGDMSMHLSFITSLAEQRAFPPEYSILPGFRLSYPFLSDSISSSLYLVGASLKLAYFLPMLLAGAQVFFAFCIFAARLLESTARGAAAWVLFFFNGGFGFVYFLTGEKSLSDLFFGFYQTPTNLVEKNIRWVNVIVDMMLPQRATLFGWAVLFPLLYLLYRAVFEKQSGYFLFVGILAGLLPMIHTHSFLAAALVCAAWLMLELLHGLSLEKRTVKILKAALLIALPTLNVVCLLVRGLADSEIFLWLAVGIAAAFVALLGWLLIKNIHLCGFKKLADTWGALFFAACALALPQLFYWTFRQVGENGMLRGHFGWVITDGTDGYLWFYLKNIGIVLIPALVGIFCANSKSFAKFSPALLIWLLAELVEFQPNNYDNNKLLYVAFAFLCCAAADCICKTLKRFKSHSLRVAAAGAAFTVFTASAVLTMAREVVAKYELFGTGAIALCNFVKENTEPTAVVLTDMRHNNEIASLSGRNIVCGSSSYLYFHGLPYQKYQQQVQEIYEHPEASADLIAELNVDYILVSDFERSSYQVDEAAIAAGYPKAYDDGVRVLYQVTKGGIA